MNKQPDINSSKVTERTRAIALKLLDENPDGLKWSELLKKIHEADPTLHPKTVNGIVWKLIETFPDQVHRTSDRNFQLKKYK